MMRFDPCVCLLMSATTTKRLASADYVRRFHELFRRTSKELVPTHVFVSEGRSGRRKFDVESIRSHDSWKPFGGRDVTHLYAGYVKGKMRIGAEYAARPQKIISAKSSVEKHYDIDPHGNFVLITLNLTRIMSRELFDDSMRLFNNLIRYADACHGSVGVGVCNLGDEYRPTSNIRIGWNGFQIDDKWGGGVAVHCHSRFESWINVLGREYVELIGRDKLLALPIYRKREDDVGRLWLQVTERPEQTHLPEVRDMMTN